MYRHSKHIDNDGGDTEFDPLDLFEPSEPEPDAPGLSRTEPAWDRWLRDLGRYDDPEWRAVADIAVLGID